MCTATWIFERDGYRLFFNRDERRERARAEGPRPGVTSGVAWLSPRDTEAGGTWLAVNELGTAVGLLNYYDAPALDVPPPSGKLSRGLLVARLAGCGGVDAVRQTLASLEVASFSPFTLLAIEPPATEETRGRVEVHQWDGAVLRHLAEPRPRLLSSSGHDAPGAHRERLKLLARLGGPTAEELRGFHRSHEPDRGAYSPCMHRPEALTVSHSEIRVRRDSVEFVYTDGPPCVADPSQPLSLPRTT